MPQVSVVIPAYNAESSIDDAIKSVRQQSLSNIEIIIVDDGSSDATYDIMARHAEADSRIRLCKHDENRGIVAAPNSGIAMASADWIAMLDADDVAEPQRLERQLSVASRRGLDLVGSQLEFFGAKDGTTRFPVNDSSIRHQLYLWKNPLANPSIMIRREVLDAYRYNDAYSHAQDYELWLRLSQDNSLKMGNCEQALVRYRVHSKQNTTTNMERVRQACFRALANILNEAGWYDARAFETHKKGFGRSKILEPEEVDHYLEWLEFLYGELHSRFGSSLEFASYWLRVCKSNSYKFRYRSDCVERLGGNFSQQMKYRFKHVFS